MGFPFPETVTPSSKIQVCGVAQRLLHSRSPLVSHCELDCSSVLRNNCDPGEPVISPEALSLPSRAVRWVGGDKVEGVAGDHRHASLFV